MKNYMKLILTATILVLSQAAFAHDGHPHPPLAGHLAYKKNTLHIHASFPTAPTVGKESLLVLEAKDAATHSPTAINDNVEVVLWMPSMGHGSAPTQVEQALDANGNPILGTLNVRKVYFIMSGDWEVRVTLTDASGEKETRSFKVSIDGEHDHGNHH
jgi:hypothetical protein